MLEIFDYGLSNSQLVLLFLSIGIALGFEFVNGFHDTANAVATVSYTNTLKPHVAVLLSGFLNFCGVFLGGIAVAMGIVKLLPVELLVSAGQGARLAMVLALLLAAILWNLGTWYKGLPASSSHTLIGSILGIGLANSAMHGSLGEGVNWAKAQEVGLSLLLSPMFGFCVAGGLFLILARTVTNPVLFRTPPKDEPPPGWVRAWLILTCSGVSFAHGSNDGQKGVGILMLILIGVVPAGFSLNLDAPQEDIARTIAATRTIDTLLVEHGDAAGAAQIAEVQEELAIIRETLLDQPSVRAVAESGRFPVRQAILLSDRALSGLVKEGHLGLTEAESAELESARKELRVLTEYAPTWVLIAVALALGIGTTVGWKRIVVTVGEKIGKSHLTYAQGASAELVAMSTIGLSTWLGLPVSTTHVLSSGVAGTMVAQGAGLQGGTVRNIGLAWLLTLPVTMLLSAALFAVLSVWLG